MDEKTVFVGDRLPTLTERICVGIIVSLTGLALGTATVFALALHAFPIAAVLGALFFLMLFFFLRLLMTKPERAGPRLLRVIGWFCIALGVCLAGFAIFGVEDRAMLEMLGYGAVTLLTGIGLWFGANRPHAS